VPAFRVKTDIVPGRVRTVWFEVPDTSPEPRQYDLFCAEYCGTGHSDMITRVNVIPADQWDEHYEKIGNMVDDLDESQLSCYAAARLYPRCASCHSLDGSTSTGPSFKDLWDRTVTGDSLFTNGDKLADIMGPGKTYENPEDYITQSITNPQKHIRENFTGAMPTFQGQLKPREIIALIDFLKDPSAVIDENGKMTVECDF
jgi:cytochrome c oxidase subunit 2